MKTPKIIVYVAAFLVLPIFQGLRAQETASQAPPVEQTLVREGDFAVKLVERLRIGTPQNEAEAETMLSSTGISPKNGWISDYPVTPDIIGELQNAVVEAADEGRLSMGREEALRIFQALSVEVGLNVVAESQAEYLSEKPPEAYSYNYEPTVVNYYDTYGPPVVTYYPPPGPYLYLYTWIAYPFWWTGWYFPGFYVLHNFHRPVYFHHPHHHHRKHVYVSNRWRDPKTDRVFVIHPARRLTGDFPRHRVTGDSRGFTTHGARRGASSILEPNRGRVPSNSPGLTRPGRVPTVGNSGASRPGGVVERRRSGHGPGNQSFRSGNAPQVRSPVGNQRIGRPSAESSFRERGSGVSGRFGGAGRPNGTIYPGARGDRSRSYAPPTGSFSKSFSPPSHRVGKSFSSPNIGNRGSFGKTYGSTGGFGFGRGGR